MSNQNETNNSLREAFALRELTKAQQSLSGGALGLVVRAALVTLFMYLVFLAHQLMGASGAAFVSLLFLISVFLPAIVRLLMRAWRQRDAGDLNARGFDMDARDEA